jgi:hypothetical protein
MSGPSFDPTQRPLAIGSWEWRAFAARFELPPDLDDPVVERRTDEYLVAPGLPAARGLKLRGGRRLELKLLEGSDGELERWSKVFSDPLPLEPWQGRVLARLLAPGAPGPVRPPPDRTAVLGFVRALRVGEPGVVVVAKTISGWLLEGGVRLERTLLELDGERLETLSLDGPSPAALRAARADLALPADAQLLSYPAWLAGRGA